MKLMKNSGALRFRYSVAYTLSFIALLWFVKTVEWALSVDFGVFGIHPRTLKGAFGILAGPLIHGDFMHLLSNSFPLILLGIGVLYFYNKIAISVFLWIYFVTGISVWIFARDAYHIGASGVVYGLVAFIFFSGLFRRDVRSIAIAFTVILLYGGMFYGIIPTDPSISWESHLLGSFTGIFCAFYYKNVPIATDTLAFQEEEEEDTPVEATLDPDAATVTWSSSAEDPNIVFRYTYADKQKGKVE